MKVYLKEVANLHFKGDRYKAIKAIEKKHELEVTIRVKKKKRKR